MPVNSHKNGRCEECSCQKPWKELERCPDCYRWLCTDCLSRTEHDCEENE